MEEREGGRENEEITERGGEKGKGGYIYPFF